MVHALGEGSDQSRFDGHGERSTHYPERGTDSSTPQGDWIDTSSITTSLELQERSSGLGDGEQRAPAMRKPNNNDLGKEKRPMRFTKKGEQTQSLRSKVIFCSSVFGNMYYNRNADKVFVVLESPLTLKRLLENCVCRKGLWNALSFLHGKREKQN